MHERLPLERVRRLAIVLVASTWVTALAFAFFPGVRSNDTRGALAQGLAWSFSDVQPPLVSMVLGLSQRAFDSLAPVLVAQLALFALACALLALQARTWTAVVVLAGFLWAPPTWAFAPILWKDVWLVIAALWCVVFVVARLPLPAIACAVAGALFRHNGLLLFPPLLAVCSLYVARTTTARVAVFALASAAMALAPAAVVRAVDAERRFPFGAIVAFDVLMVLDAEPRALATSPLAHPALERFLRGTLKPERVRDAYRDKSGVRPFRYRDLQRNRRALVAEWRRLVTTWPLTYVRVRATAFVALLNLDRHDRNHYVYPGTDGELHPLSDGPLWRVRDALLRSLAYRTWAWLVALVAALVLARRDPVALAAGAGALLYLAGYALVAGPPEARYLWPLWTSAFVVVTLGLRAGCCRASSAGCRRACCATSSAPGRDAGACPRGG